MKRAVKHSAISIYDYPRNNYSAHWEYIVQEDPKGKTRWTLRIMATEDGRVLEQHDGTGKDENDARVQAQELVGRIMVKYKRPEPLEPLTDAQADALVREFEAIREELIADPFHRRRASLLARIDQIRGYLRANGRNFVDPPSLLKPDAPAAAPQADTKPSNRSIKQWLSDTFRQ